MAADDKFGTGLLLKFSCDHYSIYISLLIYWNKAAYGNMNNLESVVEWFKCLSLNHL